MQPSHRPPPGPTAPDAKIVRLARGRHRSAQDGACVMELASMLAGEPFTDHPASVCRVIAAFLRVYNDTLPDGCREELLPYASMAVGTRSNRRLRRWRSMELMRWAHPDRSQRRIRLAARLCSSTYVAENVARDAVRLPAARRRTEVDELLERLIRGPGWPRVRTDAAPVAPPADLAAPDSTLR